MGFVTSGKHPVRNQRSKIQPAAAAKVVIASPEGWEKTLKSDQKGEVNFAPIQTGHHMLEAVKTDKTPGTHNGKSYKIGYPPGNTLYTG
jgi:hypothetical protein